MKTFKEFIKEAEKRRLDPKCWKGYRKSGTKIKGGKRVNNCVKEFTEERPVLHVLEPMEIEGVGNVNAKIDSGNEAYNVLHGLEIEVNGSDVTFTTIDNKTLTKPLYDTITIHIGSGVKEERPLVTFNITLQGKVYNDVPFSIADRSENEEPVLVGEPFIKEINALIDVNNG